MPLALSLSGRPAAAAAMPINVRRGIAFGPGASATMARLLQLFIELPFTAGQRFREVDGDAQL